MRHWTGPAIVALLAAGVVGGCGSGDRTCAHPPVTGTIAYVSSSTPPPYHLEWTVELAADRGTVTLSPGYNSTEAWSAEFTPDQGAVAQACRRLAGVADGPDGSVGGGTLEATLIGSSGRAVSLTTNESDPVDWARRAVPDAAWTDVEGRYETWKAAQLAAK